MPTQFSTSVKALKYTQQPAVCGMAALTAIQNALNTQTNAVVYSFGSDTYPKALPQNDADQLLSDIVNSRTQVVLSTN
jgi:hypothetical protein